MRSGNRAEPRPNFVCILAKIDRIHDTHETRLAMLRVVRADGHLHPVLVVHKIESWIRWITGGFTQEPADG